MRELLQKYLLEKVEELREICKVSSTAWVFVCIGALNSIVNGIAGTAYVYQSRFDNFAKTFSMNNEGDSPKLYLCHRKEAAAKNLSHNQEYQDGVLLVTEDSLDEIAKLVGLITEEQAGKYCQENNLLRGGRS